MPDDVWLVKNSNFGDGGQMVSFDPTQQPTNSAIPTPLDGRPWSKLTAPPELLAKKGMVGPAERGCYYWLARNWYSGVGNIVDAGAFVEASTASFAMGVADSVVPLDLSKPLIHAYDFFNVKSNYVKSAIKRSFRDIDLEESYIDIFHHQTAPYGKFICAHAGDFLDVRWDSSAVEILFIDVAKTEALNSHVINQFFRNLIPYRSIVIHQDYYHCWHPYIHYTMEFLDENFFVIDEHVPHQSKVWLLRKPIAESQIKCLQPGGLTGAERSYLLDRLKEKSSPTLKSMIEVVYAWDLCLQRRYSEALFALSQLGEDQHLAKQSGLWARQAIKVRQLIVEKSKALPA